MKARASSSSPHLALRQGFARCMREQPTPSERLLWAELSGGKLGVWLRRRVVIGTSIVDFLGPARSSSSKLTVATTRTSTGGARTLAETGGSSVQATASSASPLHSWPPPSWTLCSPSVRRSNRVAVTVHQSHISLCTYGGSRRSSPPLAGEGCLGPCRNHGR